MKFVVYGINILCMSEQELHLLLPYSNVAFHGIDSVVCSWESGVKMSATYSSGKWVT